MIAKSKEKNCYHDKDAEPELCEVVQAIWECFNTEEMLRQSHHPYWCNKSKSLNQMVTGFTHKDKHLSSSMLLSDWVTLVIIIDSIGYAQGICKVMEELGSPAGFNHGMLEMT